MSMGKFLQNISGISWAYAELSIKAQAPGLLLPLFREIVLGGEICRYTMGWIDFWDEWI
jgi:hypothetical protein